MLQRSLAKTADEMVPCPLRILWTGPIFSSNFSPAHWRGLTELADLGLKARKALTTQAAWKIHSDPQLSLSAALLELNFGNAAVIVAVNIRDINHKFCRCLL
jgi:hypothetical protein